MMYSALLVLLLSSQLAKSAPPSEQSELELLNALCMMWTSRSSAINIIPSPSISDVGPVELYQAFHSTLEKGHFLRVFENIDSSLRFDGELDDTMAEDPGAIAIYLNSNSSSGIESHRLNENTWFIYGAPSTAYNSLRLDSHVFLYSEDGMNGSYSIDEVYSAKGSRLFTTSPFAHFDSKGPHLTLATQKGIWERRADLSSLTIVSATLEWDPYEKIVVNDNFEIIEAEGMVIEVMEALRTILGFNLSYVVPPDGQWGSQLANGSWVGLVGMLERKEVDIVSAPLTAILERFSAMDFSYSLFQDKWTLVVNRPQGVVPNVFGYLAIFSNVSWLALAILFLLLILCFNMRSYNFGCSVDHNSLKPNPNDFDLKNSVGIVCTAMALLSYPISIKVTSARVLYLTACLSAYVLFAMYAADLTSRFTASPTPAYLNSFQDAVDNNYQVITYGGTVGETFLEKSEPGTARYRIWHESILPNLPRSLVQTVDEAIPIMMEEPKIAFFTFDTDLVHDIRFLTLDLNDALLDYSGFGFSKDSEFTDIFNFHLKSLEEQGILNKLMKKYFDPAPEVIKSLESEESATELGYDTLVFPFACLSCGLLGSGLIVALEFCKRYIH